MALADDTDVEVRREVILGLAHRRGADIDAALFKFATSYDGTDRYLLEAINVAAGERRKDLAKALADAGRVSYDNIDLVQALDPDAAARFVIRALPHKGLEPAARGRLLVRLSTIPSLAAAEAVLAVAADRTAAAETRREALAAVARNLEEDWKDLAARPEFISTVAQLLTEPDLRTTTIALVDKQSLKQCGGMLLIVAHSAEAPAEVGRGGSPRRRDCTPKGPRRPANRCWRRRDEELSRRPSKRLVDLQASGADQEARAERGCARGAQDDRARAGERLGGGLAGLAALDRRRESFRRDAQGGRIARDAARRRGDSRAVRAALFPRRIVPSDWRGRQAGRHSVLVGDDNRGRSIFFKSSAARCKSCHQVNGFGTKIGPDLSQIGKKYERRAPLETILEPSKAIAPEFVMHLVETTGGEVHAGFITEQNDKELVLKNVEGKSIRVPKADVVTTQPQKQSMMPELVLQDITAQDAADLLAFLASLTNATPEPAGE